VGTRNSISKIQGGECKKGNQKNKGPQKKTGEFCLVLRKGDKSGEGG